MAAFRRVVTAFAVLVVLAGIASAQQPFTCSVGVAVPPLLRAEGLTELTGDIVFSCTGGTVATAGLANFNVFVGNTVVTSKVASGTSGISEALLLVDEPGPATGTLAVVAPTPNGCTGELAVDCTYNTFQGLVAANSVSFNGIPIVPPGTGTRTFRITNIRINATTIGAGPGGIPGAVPAVVAISGTTSVLIPSTTVTIGFVTPGLAWDGVVDSDGEAVSGFSYRQCEELDQDEPIAYLRFRELFGTAFKPQGSADQTQPGAIYNAETGLIPDVGDGDGPSVSALASWGTRLRATFANIPLGTSVWVSTSNIENDSNSAPAGAALLTTGSQLSSWSGTSSTYRQVVASNATSGVAVWEIVDTALPSVTETYDFGVFFQATPVGQSSPATGVQGTVSGSFAPAPPAFSLSSYSTARNQYIPRFVDTGTPRDLIMFTLCQTNLLFPYVLGGVGGFDTGIAITNTSEDPWGTLPQEGTCTLNFYGVNAPAAPFVTPAIGADASGGPLWAATAMSLAQGFRGYIIAQCRFQYAHGFAFVSDIGAHDIAMGYLALVMPDIDGLGSRPATGVLPLDYGAETLNN